MYIEPQEPVVPQEPTNGDQSSDDGMILLVVAIVVGSVISVFLFIFIAFCGMLYFRKKRKQKLSFTNEAHPNYRNPLSAQEQTFPYEENRYVTADTAKLSPNYCYIFDAQMNFTNPILDSSTVTELNIYDVLSPPLTPRNLLYCKTFDYNNKTQMVMIPVVTLACVSPSMITLPP